MNSPRSPVESLKSASAKPQVVSFLEFYLQRNDEIVQAAQFVPMTDQQKQDSTAKLDQLRQQAGG